MKSSRKATGFIQIYSREARDKIYEIGKQSLVRAGIGKLTSEIFSCIDELIKNAVKANYKFLLIREKIHEKLSNLHPEKNFNEISVLIDDMLKTRDDYEALAREIMMDDDISRTVRDILNQESELLNLKNTVYLQHRKLTEEETKKIKGLTLINKIRKKVKENDLKIILTLNSDDDIISISVTNTAPLLKNDLERINSKRNEFKKCMIEKKEHEFFINNLDTSESGFGLGYAIIDSFIAKWGLDPLNHAQIIPDYNTTVILMLPLDRLKQKN